MALCRQLSKSCGELSPICNALKCMSFSLHKLLCLPIQLLESAQPASARLPKSIEVVSCSECMMQYVLTGLNDETGAGFY